MVVLKRNENAPSNARGAVDLARGLLTKAHGIDPDTWVVAGGPLQVFGQAVYRYVLEEGIEIVFVIDNGGDLFHLPGPFWAQRVASIPDFSFHCG